MGSESRTEIVFERWGWFAIRFRWPLLALILLVTVGLGSGVEKLTVTASTESFLKENDPARITYDAFRQTFANDEFLLVAVSPKTGVDVFSREFLNPLKALHDDIEDNLPYLNDVTSLINARVTYGTEDEFIVRDLFETWPISDEDIRWAKAEASANPLYKNSILSVDGRHSLIQIELSANSSTGDETFELELDVESSPGDEESRVLNNEETSAVVSEIENIVARHQSPMWETHFTGRQPLAHYLVNSILESLGRFTLISVLLISIVLFALFRRASGVFLPLLAVLLPLIATFGFMGHVGVPISATGQIMPSFLIAVGVAASIHILSMYYRALDAGTDSKEAMVEAVAHSGFAVVMTSVTTAASLSSFIFADTPPLIALGVATSFGVMLGLAYSLVLLPSLIAIIPIRRRKREAKEGHQGIDRVLAALGSFSTRHPWKVIATWAFVVSISMVFVSGLRVEHKPIEWFKRDSPLRKDAEFINDTFHAGSSYEVLIDSGQENGLYSPALLNAIDEVRVLAETNEVRNILPGRATSLVDILKETHQALNENQESHYVIPDERELIAQEFTLFEMSGSDDLEKVTDSSFRIARMSLMTPIADGLDQAVYMEESNRAFKEILGDAASVHITGIAHLTARTGKAMITSMVKSYGIALVLIFPLMILLTRSFRMGIVSMIPNLAPIIIILGLMKMIGLPLDLFSMLIGTIAIGIAVDDTIHFMHHFRLYYAETGDHRLAVEKTLLTTGRALLLTSIVLALGFYVFLGAAMQNIMNFGFITGTTVLIAFLADVNLSPALVSVLSERESRESKTKSLV